VLDPKPPNLGGFLFSEKIDNCFDSHAHWQATGEIASRLLLHNLKRPEDVLTLKLEPYHYQGDWLIGFGWNQNGWPKSEFPTRTILDRLSPDKPVNLWRADGHASWVNTVALKQAGLLSADGSVVRPLPEIQGGKILVDEKGVPTGVLIDMAKSLVDRLVPEPLPMHIRHHLLKATQIFNQAGITHIRDMSCSETQWNESMHLDQSGLLTLAVEQYFSADDPNDFDKALKLALRARTDKPQNLRVQGLKVYLDGALGSEGAWISKPYPSGSGDGLKLLTSKRLAEMMTESWSYNLDFALHTIGDEAAHQAALVARNLWDQGKKGILHLEHAEMLRPDTVELLRKQTVVCHLQPCHWLSDSKWLRDKVGSLYEYCFPWRALQENEIAFDFGSDSPIEKPSIEDNIRALKLSSQDGIAPLLGSPFRYHSYADVTWTPNTFSIFENGKPKSVAFRGQHLSV